MSAGAVRRGGRRRPAGAALLAGLLLAGCAAPPALAPPAPLPAGRWLDSLRRVRAARADSELLAGAAKLEITPRPGVIIAGHGFNKHARGVLDPLYARALYLDAGAEALVLVAVDVIGLSHGRIERIRSRLTARWGRRILIAASHTHFGPDTLGFWGPALFGLLPVRSGIDPRYMDWLERRVARAVALAAARARPARLRAGPVAVPAGLAVNLRQPGDVPKRAFVLRAEEPTGAGIATAVVYGCHAEALQDDFRMISADFPGVLCAEVEVALGGTCLFFSGPAGGMIEPASDAAAPERERVAFCRWMGGLLARAVIEAALRGLPPLAGGGLRVHTARPALPVAAQGMLALAWKLGLLEPRPRPAGRIRTEMALVELGRLRLLTVPGEPTPEVGRALAAAIGGDQQVILTLALDELAYFLSPEQWAAPAFAYERSMSLGPRATPILLETARRLAARARR